VLNLLDQRKQRLCHHRSNFCNPIRLILEQTFLAKNIKKKK
jgi:hypothetical protein